MIHQRLISVSSSFGLWSKFTATKTYRLLGASNVDIIVSFYSILYSRFLTSLQLPPNTPPRSSSSILSAVHRFPFALRSHHHQRCRKILSRSMKCQRGIVDPSVLLSSCKYTCWSSRFGPYLQQTPFERWSRRFKRCVLNSAGSLICT